MSALLRQEPLGKGGGEGFRFHFLRPTACSIRTMSPPPTPKYLYQLWYAEREDGGTSSPPPTPSSTPHLFLCCGRWRIPNSTSLFMAVSLLVTLTTIHSVIILLALLHPALLAASFTLEALTWYTLYATISKDPGLLPRHVTSLCQDLPAPSPDALGGEFFLSHALATEGSGERVEVRYCTHCRIWRPPGAYHCKLCAWCVSHMDHHCSVLGTCIGAGNLFYFYLLQLLLPLTQAFALGHCAAIVARVVQGGGSGLSPLLDSAAAPGVLGLVVFSITTLSTASICTTAVAGLVVVGMKARRAGAGVGDGGGEVDFTSNVQPLIRALQIATNAYSSSSSSSSSSPPSSVCGDPPGSWAAICSDALAESMGSTGWLGLARELANAKVKGGRSGVGGVKGVLMGWDMLPQGLCPPPSFPTLPPAMASTTQSRTPDETLST